MYGSDEIRLLALDLDGTLLAEDKSIPRENLDILKRVKEAGIETVICSGRALPGMKAILKELGPERIGRYHIGLNGGLVYDAAFDTVLRGYPMGEKAVREVIALGRSLNGEVNIHLYTKEKIYIEKRCASTAIYEKMNHCRLIQVPDLTAWAQEAIKIIFILHEGGKRKDGTGIKALAARVEPLLPVGTVGCCSCEYLYEILSRDHNKGTGLKDLAAHLDIPREKIMAMGDNDNDEAMLTFAGYSAAPRNGTPNIRKLSRYISQKDNDNGAVADAVRKIIFSESE